MQITEQKDLADRFIDLYKKAKMLLAKATTLMPLTCLTQF